MGTPRKTRKLSSTRNVLVRVKEKSDESRWESDGPDPFAVSIRFAVQQRDKWSSSSSSRFRENLRRKFIIVITWRPAGSLGNFCPSFTGSSRVDEVSISKEEKNIAVLGAPVDLRSIDLPGKAEHKRREETFRSAAFPAVATCTRRFLLRLLLLPLKRATTRRSSRWKSFSVRHPLRRPPLR